MKHNKFWFAPKRYGYGLTPISWEGWLVTLGLVGIVVLIAYANNIITGPPTKREVLFHLIELIIIIYLFMYYAKNRTNGEIKWNWGKINSK